MQRPNDSIPYPSLPVDARPDCNVKSEHWRGYANQESGDPAVDDPECMPPSTIADFGYKFNSSHLQLIHGLRRERNQEYENITPK